MIKKNLIPSPEVMAVLRIVLRGCIQIIKKQCIEKKIFEQFIENVLVTLLNA